MSFSFFAFLGFPCNFPQIKGHRNCGLCHARNQGQKRKRASSDTTAPPAGTAPKRLGTGATPQPQQGAKNTVPGRWAAELAALRAMGFTQPAELVLELLGSTQGQVDTVAGLLAG